MSIKELGDSKRKTECSLSRLVNRFHGDSNYQDRYYEFLSEYESLGHMLPVSDSELDASPVYYLPHHGVLKEQNRTTKLRVVFNGSSKTSSGISLNDILSSRANLQRDISEVLMWTHLHRWLFATEIVKMYRQIQIHPDEWNLQRILWLNPEQQRKSYRLTTVTYGLSCAPFLALRTLQQLVKDEGTRYPLAVPS